MDVKRNNADKIRSLTDEQLYRFLWTWKVNSICLFLTDGNQNGMNAMDLWKWVLDDESTFVCAETEVDEDSVFDQNFNLKEEYRDGLR